MIYVNCQRIHVEAYRIPLWFYAVSYLDWLTNNYCYKKQCNLYKEFMDYMVGSLIQACEETAKLGLLDLQKNLTNSTSRSQLEASQVEKQ
jgi:hypothetical protein